MKQLLVLLLCLAGLLARAQAGATYSRTLLAGGLVREYRLYVPPSYRPGHPAPVLLNLHGYGSDNRSQESATNFNAIADTAGFLLVCPNGSVEPGTGYRFWNAWKASSPDDVAFLNTLLDTLGRRYTLDPERLYCAGYSNGGFMSYELACHLGSRIATVASVAGSISIYNFGDCAPTHPTPVLEIHGTGDTNVVYTGGSWFEPVPTVLAYWVQANGCAMPPSTTALPDLDPGDQSTVEHVVWRGSQAGAVVEHFRVLNGGHTWPGGPPSATDVVNRDISASREVWRFLRRYRLSQLALAAAPAAAASGQPQAYPNPARGSVRFALPLGQAARASIVLYSLVGARRAEVLPETTLAAGGHDVAFSVAGWPAGLYAYVVKIGLRTYTGKLAIE